MHRDGQDQCSDGSDGSAPSEAWLFLQAIKGNPIPKLINPETKARAEREELERLAQFSSSHAEALHRLDAAEAEARHERELLEWAAKISTDCERKLHAIEQREAVERDAWRRAEEYSERLREQTYDPSKHPRAPKGQPDGGQWVAKGGASSTTTTSDVSTPFRTAAFHPSHATVRLAAVSAGTWPVAGPADAWLSKIDSRTFAGVGTATTMVGSAFATAQRNEAMAKYWGGGPAIKYLPTVCAYELDKRVAAGKLTSAAAAEIFKIAVLGAEAQGFKSTANAQSTVHKDIVDFLDKAEAVYFARKQSEEWARQPGGYQKSGGRVFPTKKNSGLDGPALRQEQERFFERGLEAGNEDWYLRGQASNAGLTRRGSAGTPSDRLEDSEVEAALQRAIKKVKK